MEAEDKIGGLFKDAFRDHKEALSLEELETMQNALSKKAFYGFNPFQFNMYYAAAIVSGFLITLLLAGHYVYTISGTEFHRKAEKTATQKTRENFPGYDQKKTIPSGSTAKSPAPVLRQESISQKVHENFSQTDPKKTILSKGSVNHPLNTLPPQEQYQRLKESAGNHDKKNGDRTDEGLKNKSNANSKITESFVAPSTTAEKTRIELITEDTISPGSDSVKPKNRTVIIIQKDTIYQIDTLPAKAKKARKK
jgi:hypothetical protein